MAGAVACSPAPADEPILPREKVDQKAWQTDFERTYPDGTFSFERIYKLIADTCDDSDDELNMQVAIAHDNGTMDNLDGLRMGMRYVCPTRVDRIDAAVKSVNSR
ncbi:TPA_asm: hypothetical protein PROPHIFSQJ01-1_99 [Mycobacterium phage prophiFSQJ01-1]|nr:TPA_asm: hypothetical protein PROPHIFSQJ01-1_99 [Mycobacterium phage prophiFSQJ01-1]